MDDPRCECGAPRSAHHLGIAGTDDGCSGFRMAEHRAANAAPAPVVVKPSVEELIDATDSDDFVEWMASRQDIIDQLVAIVGEYKKDRGK